MSKPLVEIGLLVFPQITQLDMTGPLEVLSRISNSKIDLLWKDILPVMSDRGLKLTPTLALKDATQFDVIVVPGGPGVGALMEDEEILGFLKGQARGARYMASVCTGALVLGAAGLLAGYRATTHWASLDLLPALGATPQPDRMVIDRDRATGGGVTAGIDFALRLAAELRGEEEARMIQLQLEYDPSPPFDSGHPDHATPELVTKAKAIGLAMLRERSEIVARVACRLFPA